MKVTADRICVQCVLGTSSILHFDLVLFAVETPLSAIFACDNLAFLS